ncbi:MAG: hypothetical protein GF417_12370 [Candidatus Latescibacteria bacterium]|nr:hypothetical protein [bacterium]MBD3425223.1 hypothetical protein [Candidatus Latescibacterota bacterium]
MLKRIIVSLMLLSGLCSIAAGLSPAEVTTVDFLGDMEFNAAGPFLLRVDIARNRLIAANTLSSSISIIDCGDETVRNIPIGGRGLQHLKSESLVLDPETGRICLIGDRSFHIIDPVTGEVTDIRTDCQFESAAICSGTGNVFLAGRETGGLGFYQSSSGRFTELEWLEHSEPLVNMNATPPPPARKLFYDRALSRVIGLDGYSSTIYIFDPDSGRKLAERKLEVEPRTRWHLAGYDAKRHHLHLVLETAGRKVTEAVLAEIDGDEDIITPLPGLTEGVGICFNPERNELYISYDNHPTVHVVDYNHDARLFEIKIPAYGNDGAAIDTENDVLYIASWAHGEIDVIDLKKRKLIRRIKNLGIIPHMFSFVYNPETGLIYFPRGATAVNGTFGASIAVVDPESGKSWKIRTGWAPVDLISFREGESFLVFGSEDRFAEVGPGGKYEVHHLPVDYPVTASYSPGGKIYLSYGPHQSYWPTVYIWDARNGIITIDPENREFYDRRIPRQGMDMALGKDGVLYLTQNNWGREPQFVTRLLDEVRLFEPAERIVLPDTVMRETTQRVLEYDQKEDLLYLLRSGEREGEKSAVQVISPHSASMTAKADLGVNSTDLFFDSDYIFTTDFGSGSVTAVRKSDYSTMTIPTGGSPAAGCLTGDHLAAIDHTGNRLILINRANIDELFRGRADSDIAGSYHIPFEGMPDNIFCLEGNVVITSHSRSQLAILRFDPGRERFESLLRYDYPFGDVSLAGSNSSFYMSGQFGDAIFSLNRIDSDSSGRIWVTDFLAGKLYILYPE